MVYESREEMVQGLKEEIGKLLEERLPRRGSTIDEIERITEELGQEIERKIEELTRKETKTLTEMVGVMDADQIKQVASSFKAERETLQRKADEIRLRLDRHSEMPDLSAEALARMPKSAIKDALRRAVQWIAIGREGIVTLTSFGTYIGAGFIDIPRGTYFTASTRTGIAPPAPEAAAVCLNWLLSPRDFVKGRRDYGGPMVAALTDAEILPGVFDLPDIGQAKDIEVTYEKLD